MNLYDILPVLVPGILIQFGVQAYYIKHCWDNESLTQRQKVRFIVLIAIFHITVVPIYLFYSRNDRSKYNDKALNNNNIDDYARQGVFMLLVLGFELLAFNMIYDNLHSANYNLLILLLGGCFVTMLINGLFVKPKHKLLYYLFPAIEILLVLIINYLNFTAGTQLIVLVVVASVINGFNLKEAKLYAWIAFILYLASDTFKLISAMEILDFDDLVPKIYINAFIYMLVYAASYFLKKQMIQNSLLDEAYRNLEEQSHKLEKMSIIQERNRIAGEIHDNVGHNLTTAIISIEAGEKLIENGGEKAAEKLAIAREQVRDALQKIRLSVRTIASDETEADFAYRVKSLAAEIMKNTGLKVSTILNVSSEPFPIQQSVILQAMQECATNSLKHGNSTEIDLLIQEHGGKLQFSFNDNGAGSAKIEYGFGLGNMERRVAGIGGMMHAESTPGEGFTLSIVIPTGDKTEGEQR